MSGKSATHGGVAERVGFNRSLTQTGGRFSMRATACSQQLSWVR